MSSTSLNVSLQSKTADKQNSDSRVQPARHFASNIPLDHSKFDSPVKFALNPQQITTAVDGGSEEQTLLPQKEAEQIPQAITSETLLNNRKEVGQEVAQTVLLQAKEYNKSADGKEITTLATTDRNVSSATSLQQLVSGESAFRTTAAVSQSEPSSNQFTQSPILNSAQAAVAAPVQVQTQATQATIETLPFNSSSAQIAEWAHVKVDTSAGKWGEQMMQVLHDRVSLQANQNVQEARIRLDPPELGKLDLMVRVEGDRLNVQINANTVATREALIQISDRLRTELQNQNFVHVDVNVGSGESGQQHSSHHNEQDQAQHIFASRDFSADINTQSQSDRWLSTQA